VKHVLTIIVVVAWLGMMALLVQKQAPFPSSDLASLRPIAAAADGDGAPREEWFGVYQADNKIGHTRRVTTRTASGWRFQDDSSFRLAMMGAPQQLTTTMVADTDDEYAMRAFRFVLVSSAATFTAAGESDGNHLDVRYGAGDGSERTTIPLTEPIQLPAAMRPRIAAAKPAPGTRYTHTVFSPLTLRNDQVVTVVEGPETIDGRETLRLSEEHQGMKEHVWIDGEGRAVREEASLGLQLRAEPREIALAGVDTAAPFDLTFSTRVPLAGRIENGRDRPTLTLRVSGDAADRIPDDPPRQTVRQGLLRVVREALPSHVAADAPLPAKWVGPSPFIESDDPAIIARAQAIVGDGADPLTSAQRIVDWVHEHMTQEPTVTVPSAREVLRTRRGDCNEHAVLLAALARAAGIPARVVAGVVFVDEGAEDGFYYHAWNELWLGRWVSADAVFAQVPADVTHVKLLEGGPEQHLELAGIVGHLEFATTGGNGS
jgi:hypothetical protein